MKLLTDKWALVTGSSRGVGQLIALELARRQCHVIVHGRAESNVQDTLHKLRDYPIKSYAVYGDLAKPEDVEWIIKGVKEGAAGHVDILYNNAAIQNKWLPIEELPLEEWQTTFQINFFSMVMLCAAFIPEMKQRKYGRIINLTSGIKDVPELAPYGTSKAAVDKYSQELAASLRGTNVLVNYLDPGWLRTDMGGPNGQNEPATVLPGALVPALLEDFGPSGRFYAAQDFKELVE